MNTAKKIRFSLRQVLTVPYVILILVLALTIGALSYQTGSQAVNTVSEHLLLETVGRIGQAVDRHVVGSGAVLEAAFPDGMAVAPEIESELEALRTRFWIATSLHIDPNNYVYYGNRQGQGLGLFRHSRTDGELRVKLKAEDKRSFYRFKGIDGALELASQEAKLFDPRERPWYKAGAVEKLHTWTSVYIDFVTEDLVATRARRVVGRTGQFEGVVATDISLRALNDFVTKLKISPNGLAFIVEPNGDLIASSASPNVITLADKTKARVPALQSGSPLQAAIYKEVTARLQGIDLPQTAQTFNFTAPDGQVIHVGFDRLKDDAGLKWVTVVATPRSDFMAGVTSNVVRTAILSALAALVAIAIGMRILNLLVRDLKLLSQAAVHSVDSGLDWPDDASRPLEIGDLARSFVSMQQRLQTDDLTKLANRDAFMIRLRERIKSAQLAGGERFAVLFIDLDRFKHVNDKFGHSVGDQVLVEVAQRLKEAVRTDDMVARMSGDEYVVLLDRVSDREGLDRVRRQIQTALKAPLKALDELALEVLDFGGSVGDAIFPDDGTDAEALLKKADRRMYGRKFSMRNHMDKGPRRRESDSIFSGLDK